MIPQDLRQEMLEKLHLGHIGVQGTLRRAREILFWPGISNDINQYSAQVVLGRGKNRAASNFLPELFYKGSKAIA